MNRIRVYPNFAASIPKPSQEKGAVASVLDIVLDPGEKVVLSNLLPSGEMILFTEIEPNEAGDREEEIHSFLKMVWGIISNLLMTPGAKEISGEKLLVSFVMHLFATFDGKTESGPAFRIQRVVCDHVTGQRMGHAPDVSGLLSTFLMAVGEEVHQRQKNQDKAEQNKSQDGFTVDGAAYQPVGGDEKTQEWIIRASQDAEFRMASYIHGVPKGVDLLNMVVQQILGLAKNEHDERK